MTSMAAMPVSGKLFQKRSSPEPIDRLPWNLVCSIGVPVHIVVYSTDD